jgi:hypothetical protein
MNGLSSTFWIRSSLLLRKGRAGLRFHFLYVILPSWVYLSKHANFRSGRNEQFLKDRIAYTDMFIINAGITGILPKAVRPVLGTLASIPVQNLIKKCWILMDSAPQPSKGRLRGCLYTWFRFPRTFHKLRITKLGLQIRRQNTWPVLPPKPKSTKRSSAMLV